MCREARKDNTVVPNRTCHEWDGCIFSGLPAAFSAAPSFQHKNSGQLPRDQKDIARQCQSKERLEISSPETLMKSTGSPLRLCEMVVLEIPSRLQQMKMALHQRCLE